MSNAIAITGPTGAIFIELSAQPNVVASSSQGTAGVADLANRLEQVAGAIVSVCSSLHDKAFSALAAKRPNTFEVEFGISLAGEAGVPLVTKGSVECTFKVTAKWDASTPVG